MGGGSAQHTRRSSLTGPTRATVRARLDATATLSGSLAIGPQGRLYAQTADGNVRPLRDGQRLDARSVPARLERDDGHGPDLTPALRGDGTVLVAAARTLSAMDMTGVRWTFEAPANVTVSPTLLLGGDVVIGDAAGNVHAVDPTGALRWHSALGTSVTGVAAAPFDRRMHVSTVEGTLFALDAHDGALRWSLRVAEGPLGAPAVAPSGVTWVGCAAGLHAVSPDGSTLWLAPLGPVRHAPALGRDGGAVVGAAGAIHALRSDGTIRWTHRAGSRLAAPPVVDVVGNAYFTTADRRVVALRDDGAHAEPLWELDLEDDPRGSPVIAPIGTLYVSTARGIVLEIGAPLSGFGRTLVPTRCTCAIERCTPALDLCAAEPGCVEIVRCARERRCRGSACRHPDACDETIRSYGGTLAQSGVLAAGVDECVRRECGGCP